ncbi:MAG TPA: fibronectin type III domain-containing protein [Candidatus Saccharimonadales bacterium]|nr:fibronectin type III domain-containing protein [Candidatus Saccharimonadales bacterium]
MSGPVRYVASGGQWRALSGAALNNTRATAPGIVSAAYDTTTDLLTVQLSVPLSNGGSAITGYTVVATPQGGGVVQYASSSGMNLAVTNLIMGVTYAITAYATNAGGNGTASAATMVAVPMKTYVKPQTHNTGIPRGMPGDSRTPAPALTPVTGLEFEDIIQATNGNVTIQNYEITGAFNLRRDDITFRNCYFTSNQGTQGDSLFPLIVAGGSPAASRVNFVDCEFNGNGLNQIDPQGDLTQGFGLSEPCNLVTQNHLRSNIYSFVDGFRNTDNGRYESCYVHDLVYFWTQTDSTHNDGFQFVGEVDNMMVIGCNFELATSPYLSSILQVNALSAPGSYRTRISIVHNWWQGGGYYVISGYPDVVNEEISMVFAHNRFSLQSGAEQIWYPQDDWRIALNQGKLTLVNNVWDATGTTTGGLQVTENSLIPVPELNG